MDFSGIWPVAPTPFHPNGQTDEDGMRRVLDCMIDQGADGICVLANYSEQFLLGDPEWKALMQLSLAHVAGRVPVIVTVNHYSTAVAVKKAVSAREAGASAFMMMPPFYGVGMQPGPQQVFERFKVMGDLGLPLMVQDAPVSGVDLPVPLLAKMAREIEMLQAFKIECPRAADKIRALVAAGVADHATPLDGEEGITLMADLEAGARGAMTSALLPDLIGPVIAAFARGDRAAARAGHARVLPAINHENRQCGFLATKAAMVAGGVIASDFSRHPVQPLAPETRAQLLDLLAPLDPLVLRWGK